MDSFEDSFENEPSGQQSVYPDIDPLEPAPDLSGHFPRPQYTMNPSRQASPNDSEILSDNDRGDQVSNESPRRKRRRLFEAAISDYDDPDVVLSEESSVSEGETPEDTNAGDDATHYGNDDETAYPLRRRRRRYGPGGRGPKRGPRKPIEPSPEFKQLHSEATLAFIDSDYDRAVTLVKQAIQINPEIFAAHSLLSEIFLAQGVKGKALAAFFSAAHTRPKDPGVWKKLAKLVKERGGDNETSVLKGSIYCYNRQIDIDQKDYRARFDRAAAYRELGQNGKALHEYERLLNDIPHNTEALRHLAEVCIDLDDVEKAVKRYDESIAYYKSLDLEDASDFSWSDVNVYTDLFAYQKEYMGGISHLRSLARWLLGRKDDAEWEAVPHDDREWDAEHFPRRFHTPWFHEGQYPLDTYGYGLPLELRIKMGLFRLRLGSRHHDEALYHFGWLEPRHVSSSGKLFDYGDLFREVADALKEEALHQQALRFYVPLQYLQEYADTSLYMAMADCHAACQNDEEAESCYLTVAEYDLKSIEARAKLAKFYEKMGLVDQAMKYVTEAIELGQAESMPRGKRRFRRRAAQLARELRSTEVEGHELDDRAEGQNALISFTGPTGAVAAHDGGVEDEADQSVQDGDNVRYLHRKMLELQLPMRSGDQNATEDWLDIADALVRDFRSTSVFFPIRRRMVFLGYSREAQRRAGRLKSTTLMDEVQDIADRLQAVLGNVPEIDPNAVPTNYHGISFDDWLDIFLEYAFVVAGQGQSDEAYNTLSAAADASVWYHSKPSTRQIYICWFTCAVRLADEEVLTGIARWFMKEYQFVTDTYRLFATLSCVSGNPRKSLFHSSASMKFVLRHIRAVDLTVPRDPTSRTPRPAPASSQGRAIFTTKDESGQPIPAAEMDVALLTLYGHILYTGNSFPGALNYFFRAYALDPNNPVVLLSIGLSYIHQAIKRQAENRHYMIMQGLSFMQEYRRVREQSAVPQERQEMEFNFARVYHMLGLSHLAIDGYEKCLSLNNEIEGAAREQQMKHGEGKGDLDDNGSRRNVWTENFCREAAYALQCLYAFSGEMESAKQVTERWLVI